MLSTSSKPPTDFWQKVKLQRPRRSASLSCSVSQYETILTFLDVCRVCGRLLELVDSWNNLNSVNALIQVASIRDKVQEAVTQIEKISRRVCGRLDKQSWSRNLLHFIRNLVTFLLISREYAGHSDVCLTTRPFYLKQKAYKLPAPNCCWGLYKS